MLNSNRRQQADLQANKSRFNTEALARHLALTETNTKQLRLLQNDIISSNK